MIKGQRGFSLLEVLVAFAILGVALGVLLQIFATGMRATTLSEDYTYAASLAETKLATIGVEAPYLEGIEEGRFDQKYSWRTTILPYEEPQEALEELERRQISQGGGFDNNLMNLSVLPYRVRVEVFWETGGGKVREVALETLRLGSMLP
ncbi:type IV pilus modification PilV family protein [Nitrosococcus watsonii]|uniref:General secretion pathway protein H n=1 Tax=Nitrosococcus watsoni (strain C-113) TaxID=105559 RepID=D8KC39_NITWC|nr:type II secretion system protein [Nitrosococcus watsonii]ADJ29710.1 general secretion pathway protein H [Nitrosococcus watsonii C-113]